MLKRLRSVSNPLLPAVLALAAVIMLWSCNWVVMKSALSYIGPLEFAALRSFLGSLLLFPFLFFTGRKLAPPPLAATISIGFFQTFGMVGVSQLALVSGGAGNTAVLVYTMPFWMILFGALLLGEKITRVQGVSMFFAATGLLLVMRPWEGGGTLTSSGLAVLSGLLWAVGSVLTKRLYREHGDVDVLNLTAWQIFFGSIVIIAAAACVHEQPIVWSGYLFFALAYNIVLATAVAWPLWFFVLRALPTSISGLSMLLNPVSSVLLAWLLLGETPGGAQLWGIVCIVTGIIMATGAAAFIKRLVLKYFKR